MPNAASTRLNSLTGLRFLAALSIVLFHTVEHNQKSISLTFIPGLGNLAALGYIGVTFFFVLSGFVMAWTHAPDDDMRAFYQKRFARIAPLHVATWIVAMAGNVVLAGTFAPGVAVATFCLVQAWIPDVTYYFGGNGVSWSLSCEAFFYALFPFVILLVAGRPRRMLAAAVIGFAAMLGAGLYQTLLGEPYPNSEDLWVLPLFGFGQFAIGVCAGAAVRSGVRLRRFHILVVLATAATYILLCFIDDQLHDRYQLAVSRPLASVVMTPFFACLIMSSASRDLAGTRAWYASRLMVRLGAWSFALYMIHSILLALMTHLLHVRQPESLVGNIGLEAGFVLACVLCSGLVYSLFEHPLERRLRPRSRDSDGSRRSGIPQANRVTNESAVMK